MILRAAKRYRGELVFLLVLFVISGGIVALYPEPPEPIPTLEAPLEVTVGQKLHEWAFEIAPGWGGTLGEMVELVRRAQNDQYASAAIDGFEIHVSVLDEEGWISAGLSLDYVTWTGVWQPVGDGLWRWVEGSKSEAVF